MGLYDVTFYDLISQNAVVFSGCPAWYEADDDRAVTFSRFKDTVDCLAAGLQKKGIKKGDRIGVLGQNSLEYFSLYGAAAALGAVMLPVNWRLSAEEVAFNLNDCGPVVLFVDPEFSEMISGIRDQLSSIRSVYTLGVDNGYFGDMASLFDNDGVFEPVDVAGTDGFVIIHTAAVAGRPRGALLSHGNLLCANLVLNYGLNLGSGDVHLNLLPLFHVGGLFMATNSFQAGAQNINMRKFDAEKAVDLIERFKVSILFDFSPILSAILSAGEKTGGAIDSLRAVMGLDTPETIETYQTRTGGTFYSLFGQTETSCVVSMGPYSERPGSAGRPVSLAMVRLLDDNDTPVPQGEIGEIAVKGPMVFQGYWNLPQDTAATFRSGWHHTGDLGRLDADGYLWYSGRKAEKELIKPGGENVYPAEVEKVILQHPAVEKTAVIGVPDPKWKEAIKAVCQLKPGQSLTSGALIRFVGERIARFKKPQHVEFVTEMPLTAGGEIDRRKVKELFGSL
jgi:acyl-CoA synthetase (AMP-forming)/AMP-acid ligase II